MKGTSDPHTRSENDRERDQRPDSTSDHAERATRNFIRARDHAQDIGWQMFRGAAYGAGRHILDRAADNIENHPHHNFLSRLIDWVVSLWH